MADVCDNPEALDRENDAVREHRLVDALGGSRLYRDYAEAFVKTTGLPLVLRPVGSYRVAKARERVGSRFCALVAQTSAGCAQCLAMQKRLEDEAGIEPKTLHCFAGLCDSAVPVRVGEQVIAFLETGQILLHEPNRAEFSRTTRQLLAWGSQVNLKSLEEAYFQTRVLDEGQYEAMVRLLAIFAEHLGAISARLEMEAEMGDPRMVSRAKTYIREHFRRPIPLDEAAQAVNASTRHFCKVFKEATGITFTDYLARVRVEKAKHLLRNPHLRVSEIAFETGFESISQFNRSFRRITGRSPTMFRKVAL